MAHTLNADRPNAPLCDASGHVMDGSRKSRKDTDMDTASSTHYIASAALRRRLRLTEAERLAEDRDDRDTVGRIVDDPVFRFLHDLDTDGYGVLTPEQEAAAFRAMRDDREVRRSSAGDRKQRNPKTLSLAAQAARQQLICHNLKLVFKIACDIEKASTETWGLERLDLVDEGVTGLIAAVDGFDPTTGHRFSTYAGPCIRNAIYKALRRQADLVRSYPRGKLAASIRKSQADLQQQLGREPTAAQIGQALGIDPGAVRRILASVQTTTSLERPQDQSGGEIGSQQLADQRAVDVVEVAIRTDLYPRLMTAIGSLSPRECRFLLKRFGTDGKRPRTYAEIAGSEGCSAPWACMVVNGALRKLRTDLS